MTRNQGFSRGDIDTAFPLDDKFLALRGRLPPERYYAVVGVYFTIVAANWREAERKVALRVAPDAADLIDELTAVGLLGSDGRVTSRVFSSWIGRALKLRRAASKRQAANRAGKSRVTDGDSHETDSQSQGVPIPRATPLGTVGKEGTENDVEGGAGGDRDALDRYHELTLYRPWGQWSGDKLRGAIADYGDTAVVTALDEAYAADPDKRNLLDRALATLARNAERTKREAAQRPKPVRPKPKAKETNDELMKLYAINGAKQ
jgi:hypothetical protein